MIRSQKKIGEILLEKGLVGAENLKQGLQEQQKTKEFLGAILIKKGWIKEYDLLLALSEQFNIPIMSLKNKYIDWEFVKSFSTSLILDHKCFPVQRNDFSITFAITNPLDMWVVKKAEEEAKGFKMKLALVSQADMEEVIQRYHRVLRKDITKLWE